MALTAPLPHALYTPSSDVHEPASDVHEPAAQDTAAMIGPPRMQAVTRIGSRPLLHVIVGLVTALIIPPVATTAAEETCAGGSGQSSLNDCAGRALKAADQSLNEAYKALIERVSPQGRSALQTAQRAWIVYRDEQCAFETAGSADGSIHPMAVAACLRDLTVAQTRRLEAQLQCEEGDLSCGDQ